MRLRQASAAKLGDACTPTHLSRTLKNALRQAALPKLDPTSMPRAIATSINASAVQAIQANAAPRPPHRKRTLKHQRPVTRLLTSDAQIMIRIPTSMPKAGAVLARATPGGIQEEGPLDLQMEDAATDEDVVSIPAPTSLPIRVSEVVVGARCLTVFDILFNTDSAFRNKMVGKEGLRDIFTSEWTRHPGRDPGSKIRSRTMTYIRPLAIPLPIAPKQCRVTEVHTMQIREAGGFVVQVKVTTNAPKGDAFFVLIQWAGVAEAGGKTRLRISCKVEFVQRVGLLTAIIEGAAVSSSKMLLQAWVDELVQDLGRRPNSKPASASACIEE